MDAAVKRTLDVLHVHRLGGIVADASGRAQEDHRGRDFFGKDHGVVASAAGHAMRLAAGIADGVLDLFGEERVHGHGTLREEGAPGNREAAFGCDGFGLAGEFVERLGARGVGRVTKVQPTVATRPGVRRARASVAAIHSAAAASASWRRCMGVVPA